MATSEENNQLSYIHRPEKQIEDECVLILNRLAQKGMTIGRQISVQFGSTHRHRADIVIRKGNKSLLVIECKAKPKFSETDVLQAESYALVLRAPFFALHNGEDWKFYQTNDESHNPISKNDLSDSNTTSTEDRIDRLNNKLDDLIERAKRILNEPSLNHQDTSNSKTGQLSQAIDAFNSLSKNVDDFGREVEEFAALANKVLNEHPENMSVTSGVVEKEYGSIGRR